MKSIIILAYNQHEMTKMCIETVRANTEDFEIVLVDNGSDPRMIDYGDVNVRNETNLGFPAGVNQGIRAAKGDIIILLNNDVIVTPGWADRLTAVLDRFDIVGPMANYVAGVQLVSLPTYYSEEDLNREAENWRSAHSGELQEVNWVIGFCMAFRKSLFEEVGEFDTSLWPCSGEEVDFCKRAKDMGKRVGVVRDLYVHHFGKTTFNDLERDGLITSYKDICYQTDRHLIKRYGKEIFNQVTEDAPVAGGIRLNLGCGYVHMDGSDWVNIDNRPECQPNLLCDVLGGLPYGDSTVDEVRAHDFLEHVPIGKVIPLMEDIWRVLKPGGIFNSMTPSTDGRGAFQDPTHVSFWNQNSWLYYSDPAYRGLYGIKADFEILKIEDSLPDTKYRRVYTTVRARARKGV